MWEKRKANVYTADSIYNVQVDGKKTKKKKKKTAVCMYLGWVVYMFTQMGYDLLQLRGPHPHPE